MLHNLSYAQHSAAVTTGCVWMQRKANGLLLFYFLGNTLNDSIPFSLIQLPIPYQP